MMEKALSFLERFKSYFSRKFLLACATLGLGYRLVLEGKDIEGWAILVGVVLAFFNGADVTEKIATLRSGRLRLKTKETVETTEVTHGNPD
jgi:hypothetical protein